jgi:hypothetical protein
MVNSKIEIKIYVDVLVFFCKRTVSMVTAYVNCENKHAFLRNISVILNAFYIYNKSMLKYIFLFLLMIYEVHDAE